MAADSPSRRLLLVGVVLLLVVPPLAYWQLDGWRRLQMARRALAAIHVCLYGSSPGVPSDAQQRLRGSAITASLTADEGDWPRRCAVYALRLEQTVRALRAQRVEQLATDGDRGGCPRDHRCRRLTELLGQLDRLRGFLRSAELGPFEPAVVADLAAQLDLGGGVAPGVRPPPTPARLLSPEQMRPLYRGNYLRLLTDPAGHDVLQLLFYEQRVHYGLCAVDLRVAEAARCRILPGSIPADYAGELLAAEPGAPSVLYAQGFVGDRWTEGLYDADTGRQITRVPTRPSGGMVWNDGTMVRLDPHAAGNEVELVFRRPDGTEESHATPVAQEVTAGPRLIWRHIVWTLAAGDGRHRLYAQRVVPGPERFGPIRELGTTEPLVGKPEFDMCRTDEALVLLVTGPRRDRPLNGTLVFRTPTGWQPPIGLRIGSGRYGFTCQAHRATLSWITGVDEEYAVDDAPQARAPSASQSLPVRGRYRVSRLRCRADGCDRARVAIELDRHSRDSRYVAGDLGEAMVVLWRSPLGDVRMRLAPIDRLPQAQEVPLFDDLEHGGFGWDLERDPIFGRAGEVLVLVSAQVAELEQSWTYGIRLDTEGRASPVDVITASPRGAP